MAFRQPLLRWPLMTRSRHHHTATWTAFAPTVSATRACPIFPVFSSTTVPMQFQIPMKKSKRYPCSVTINLTGVKTMIPGNISSRLRRSRTEVAIQKKKKIRKAQQKMLPRKLLEFTKTTSMRR